MKTYKIIFSAFALVIAVGMMSGCGESAGDNSVKETTTTTTTTAATTTAEQAETPSETTTITTTAVEETPEQTETEAAESSEAESSPETTAPVEQPEDTGIVTYPDNDEGMYPMKECFRRIAEEHSGHKVISIDESEYLNTYQATMDNGDVYGLVPGGNRGYLLYSDELTDINDYMLSDEPIADFCAMISYTNYDL